MAASSDNGEKAFVAARVMFVEVGQSPRTDVIAEIKDSLDISIDAVEVGALDGLSRAEIDEFRALEGDPALLSRLADGSEVVLSKPAMAARIADIVAALPANTFDLVVILSTGLFRDFESSLPTVNAQRAMESAVMSLAARGDAVGLVQPLEQQVAELDVRALGPYRVEATYASEGDADSLRRACEALCPCDVIVLNSVGFSEADRQVVAQAAQTPVVLARRIIASAIRLLLAQPQTPAMPHMDPALARKLDTLTPREQQVLSLAAEGLSNKAVARQLDISPKTVEIHRSNVMRKLEVTSSAALIRLVIGGGTL